VLKRRFLMVATCVIGVMSIGSGAVLAGEVNGRGERIPAPDRAKSICVFSGLNDDPDAPLVLDDFTVAPNGPGGRTQTFGQDVKLGRDPHVFTPGDACRGNVEHAE
jgi:hypothetical protein